MPRRTKEEAQETRRALLDAAERVFSRRGVSRTSLTDIAEAAGVTRGAIYWHFSNKADLIEAMLGRVTLPLEQAAQEMSGQHPDDPLQQVKQCMLGALMATATDAQAQRVFDILTHKCEYVDELYAVRERSLEMRVQCLKNVEKNLKRAITLGQLPATVNARLAAVGLHAMVDGLISNWLLDRRYVSLARQAESLVDLFLEGLRGVPAAVKTGRK